MSAGLYKTFILELAFLLRDFPGGDVDEHLFGPDTALTTDQRNSSREVWLTEPVS